jgi:cell division septation protein DedD
MRSPRPDPNPGDAELYGSPAEVAGDLNVSLLGALPPSHSELDLPLQLSQLLDSGTAYDAIVDRIELLSGQMPVRLLGCLGLADDHLRYRLAVNLGARLARNGKTVTVVEADLGRPMLAVEPAQREGLIDMLLYGCSYSVVARTSAIPNLKVVTAGSHPWSGEPIPADEWDRVLGAFRSHSDVTLLTGTTAIPSTVLSMLARRLDWILIAYALGAGSRHEIRCSYLALWDMDAPILGMVAERTVGSEPAVEPPARAEEAAGAFPSESELVRPAAMTDPTLRSWGEDAPSGVTGLEEAEVVIRETRALEVDPAALWEEEFARLRESAAPPSGSAPFAGMETAVAASEPEPEPEIMEQQAPPEVAPESIELREEDAVPDEPRDPFEVMWHEKVDAAGVGDEAGAERDADTRREADTPREGDTRREARQPMEFVADEAAAGSSEQLEGGYVDWPDVAPVVPSAAPGERVVNAIEEIEGELVGRRPVEVRPPHPPVPVGKASSGTGHKPWRLLVPGAVIGIAALLFWAYQNDVIQFERRPPRTPTSAAPSASNGAGATDAGAVGSPPTSEPGGAIAPTGTTAPPKTSTPSGATPAPTKPAPTQPAPPKTAESKPAPTKSAPVPPEPTKPAATEPGASAPAQPGPAGAQPTGFGVHVSSFQTVAKANEDLQRFQGIGYRGVIITVQVPGRGSWRRVILGPYPTLEEAQSVMQAVREDGLSPKAETMKLGP